MHKTLALWHADHVNFTNLLRVLDDQLALFHEGDTPQYELMLDIMYYMTHYCDVVHHPKEDLVFAEIKARDKSIAPKVDALIEQHASLKDLGEKLAHDLDDIVNGSVSPREHVEADARRYVTGLRNHMRAEETDILPLAARLLRDEDWSKIDDAVKHIEDPLFGSSAEARYAALREQIARQARTAP
jgi:hemerythrin-like domain-containing protein